MPWKQTEPMNEKGRCAVLASKGQQTIKDLCRDFGSEAKKIMVNFPGECGISLAGIWEASIKVALGKLKLPYDLKRDLPRLIDENSFPLLAIDLDDATGVSDLPHHHGDPFDRLMTIQAMPRGLRVISRDPVFERYGLRWERLTTPAYAEILNSQRNTHANAQRYCQSHLLAMIHHFRIKTLPGFGQCGKTGVVAMLVVLGSLPVASGEFFTVGKHGDYHAFIDPEGNPFFSAGVCVTTPRGFTPPPGGSSPYQESVLEIYGSDEAWAESTVRRFREWNLNSLGAWSDIGLLGKEIPYTLNLSLSPSNWVDGNIPDFWSAEFFEHVDRQVQRHVAPRMGDPMLIGYYFDNELRWGPDWRGLADMFATYFQLPADAPGKIALVAWLRERYGGDIEALRAVWGFRVESFDELHSIRKIAPLSINRRRRADRAAFTGYVAEQFFRACHDAIREVDPNHLILGVRFVSWLTPHEVLDALVDYTDVISVNHYPLRSSLQSLLLKIGRWQGWVSPENMLSHFHSPNGKPVIITEFYFRAKDSGLPNTRPPAWLLLNARDQERRADMFEDYARSAFEAPHIIGWHWFAFMDQPPEGRFDGENSNVGLVGNEDKPWEILTRRMQSVNREGLEKRGGLPSPPK